MDIVIKDGKLKRAYEAGQTGWHQPAVVKGFDRLMSALDAAVSFDDVKALQQFRPHPLKGKREGEWGIDLSANYRAIIEFREDDDGPFVQINEVVDYH